MGLIHLGFNLTVLLMSANPTKSTVDQKFVLSGRKKTEYLSFHLSYTLYFLYNPIFLHPFALSNHRIQTFVMMIDFQLFWQGVAFISVLYIRVCSVLVDVATIYPFVACLWVWHDVSVFFYLLPEQMCLLVM